MLFRQWTNLKKGKKDQMLDFSLLSYQKRFVISSFLPYQNLQNLALRGFFKDSDLNFLEYLINLEVLDLDNQADTWMIKRLTGKFLTKYCMRLNKVRVLRIKSLRIEPKWLKTYLEQKGKAIENLSISNLQEASQFIPLCPNLSVIKSYGSAQKILTEVRNAKIQKLELKGNFQREAFDQFFGVKYSKLYKVSIENSGSFSDECLQTLLQNGGNIQSLKLKSLIQLTNSMLQQIGYYGQNYESISLIDLSQITHSTLSFIFIQCQKLKSIELAQLANIDSEIFQVISLNELQLQALKLTQLVIKGINNWITEIAQMRQLNYLRLQNLSLNDSNITQLLQKATKLKTLDLSSNQITSSSFPINDQNQQPYPIYKKLKVLKVTFQNQILLEQFRRLKQKFGRIRIFNEDREIEKRILDTDFDL